MAVVRHAVGGSGKPAAKGAAGAGEGSVPRTAGKPTIVLPSELSVPLEHFSDYITLIYGEKKVGKTSLAARFPNTLFLMCEPGGKALRIYQQPITSWQDFVASVDALKADKRFNTVVVDTVDVAYAMCFDFMCKKMAIVHPGDESDYGKSWGMISKEFQRQFNRLFQTGKGVILTSHATWQEIKSRRTESYFRLVPTMPGQANAYLTAVVDIWGCYTYAGKDRYLILRGDEQISAGCRLEEQFRTVKGEPVVAIPMGTSADAAYKNVMTAFNNKQKDTGAAALEETVPVVRAARK
jgi:hypothetical protein